MKKGREGRRAGGKQGVGMKVGKEGIKTFAIGIHRIRNKILSICKYISIVESEG